ncbi:pilus assembly protein PilZ [Shewanella sp. BC20]|uniref:pilus assembly protein PilZ n=1 Tax=Shewanella sp. BC20 TaxID=2004459 RepID=UPI000D652F55|nr:pilus assembly protein PilZ [Shewanella sp. BC20]PWF61688.1 pilus assembly protein PilZ [Shewanella sp. BC20]
MNMHEEFVHSESAVDSELEYQVIEFDNRRTHPRLSLRYDKRVPLAFACDGLTVNLSTTRWLVFTEVDTANIKDISIGGVGFLCSKSLPIGMKFYVELELHRILCEVTRVQLIKGHLTFIGARWINGNNSDVQSLIDAIKLRAKI